MKKNKLKLVIGIASCLVLASIVVAIVLLQPKHKHTLGEVKTYHITNDGVYYTRSCNDGYTERFETDASFDEVLAISNEEVNIVLDENITLNHELTLKSIALENGNPKGINLNINLDLNNYTLQTAVDTVENNSIFMLNANYGTINLNIKNGKIYSQDLLYIFRFVNSDNLDENIKLKLNDVECKVIGSKATPLFAHNESSGIIVNATNSKFISKKSTEEASDYGVGAFVNSESEFNFNNCYFEGGDAVYVKQGIVNLIECELVNAGLDKRFEQVNEKFTAIGTCLATETYTTADGATQFEITITDCKMIGNNSNIMVYVAQTAEEELTPGINNESSITINSCSFNNDPVAMIPDYGIIYYQNNTLPINDGAEWVVG